MCMYCVKRWMGKFITCIEEKFVRKRLHFSRGSSTVLRVVMIKISRLLDSCTLRDYNFDEKYYKNLPRDRLTN